MAKGDRNQDKARLVVRLLRKTDLPAVQALQRLCFPSLEPWEKAQLDRQIDTFADGQICIELDGTLIATSSSLIVHESDFPAGHTFADVSSDGLIANHSAEGDTLYGIDIAVHPKHRGMRLSRRIYDARKDLSRRLNLRAILIAGRIPGFAKYKDTMQPEEYVRRVVQKELKDDVLTAQTSNGFAIRQVIRGYLPSDTESAGCAVFMEWLNHQHMPKTAKKLARTVRVAAVQYQMRAITTFDEFGQQCEFFVDASGDYRMDFLLFPELLTNQLHSLVKADRPSETARRLDELTPAYLSLFTRLALKYNVNIVGGTHLTIEDGQLYNVAYLFRRDGSVEKQRKLHVSQPEAHWWGVAPGDDIRVFETDRGRVAILIGYDIEFPEAARIATAKGASILFVPFNTDIRSAYLRIRSCAQARCIENHVYAVLSGPVGNLPFVAGADIHYGQACILTPLGLPFARDGIADEATPNVETMVVHELDLEVLRRTRRTGAVCPWLHRRNDLYSVSWRDEDGEHLV